MVPRPKRPRSQPPGTRHTPAGARWRNSRARIQPASVQPRQHANPAQPAHQPSRAHPASAGMRTPTPRGGERVARDSVFGRSRSKVRTTRFPLPPKTAQASRRTPQNCNFSSQFSPIWNCMTPARRETLSVNSHIAPKQHSWPAPLSQFATFRNLPCPRHPRSQPPGVRHTAAKRPRMPQATVQRAGGGLPMRHISPRCCEFPGLCESGHPNFCEFPGLCERNAPARAGFPGCAKNPIRITRKTHTHQVLMPTPAN